MEESNKDRSEVSRDLLVRIAKLYYLQNQSQQQIAQQVGVSRSNVSRLLKIAREQNIVEIRVHDSSPMSDVLEGELSKLFRLKRVIVVSGFLPLEQAKMQVGQAAARSLAKFLHDGMTVGISWGSSLYYLVKDFVSPRPLNVSVVQLIGGSGARDLSTDGLELARGLSSKLNGDCRVLQAPLVVQTHRLQQMLSQEPDIRSVLDQARRVDVAVVGIGTTKSDQSALLRAGYLNESNVGELERLGVVGDILGYQMDPQGRIVPVEINRRLIGLHPDDLKQIPTVIGVAAGAAKADAILAALRGGYLSMLVTDDSAAIRILSLSHESGKDGKTRAGATSTGAQQGRARSRLTKPLAEKPQSPKKK